MLEKDWASPRDFATLFQYFWHRDFPLDKKAVGAHRADWTMHIGIVVRNIADLMGLVTRFETGGKKDAVLRSTEGDEIALEWEWEDLTRAKEIDHLKHHLVWSKDKSKERVLKYGVLIGYSPISEIEEVRKHVKSKWEGARWPLLLIVIEYKPIDYKLLDQIKFSSGREFNKMRMFLLDNLGQAEEIRYAPACPWNVTDAHYLQRLG